MTTLPVRTDPSPASPRPLLATGDPRLLDALVDVCSLAGVEPEVVVDASALRVSWATASVVLVGHDLAAELGGQYRRRGVVLVGEESVDNDPGGNLWGLAVQIGAEQVALLPEARSWLVDRLARTAEAPQMAPAVGVVGGRGGAGASCLAAALAVTAARDGLTPALVDLDPLGGGLDLLMAGEDVPGARWPDLAHVRGRLPARALLDALPSTAGVHVLAWARAGTPDPESVVGADAVRSVLAALRRSTDLVVVDLSRRLDAGARAALASIALGLVVVPAEVRAAAAGAQVAAALRAHVADVRVLVRGPSPSGLAAEVVADLVGLPLVGWLPAEPGLAEALDRGDIPARSGRGPLARTCRSVLDLVGSLTAAGAAA